MSSDESTRKAARNKQGSHEQGNSTQAQRKHSGEGHRPLPFDDDDTGTGELNQTTDPQKPNIETDS